MEEFYFEQTCRLSPGTLLKVTLLHGSFSRFLIVPVVPNRAKRLIWYHLLKIEMQSNSFFKYMLIG